MSENRWQFFILLLAALFHPIVERWLRPWGLSVDYPFLVVFWIALRRGRTPGAFYGFFIGLLRDLGNFSMLGASALAYALVGYAVGDLREKVDRDNLGTRLVLLAAAVLATQAVILLPRSGWSVGSALWAWARYALAGAPLNALVYAFVLLVVHLIREGTRLLNEPAQRS
ncbi:MAG: rod shape-determining protein MreD [Candidatus Krumholzibacteriia bacterium]|nr:rod shape-determining protein MreD [bacterium]MCB9513300.1 rod shape-determining protein MreD [Candidatus Latescibacterota bacterium]MCB9514760.1 rod shape-determining protein MreD [Candidatus Latescibacterota bacterium]